MAGQRSPAAVLACAAGALAPASAQEKMRPGLWEHSVTMKSQSGQMEAALAEAQKAMATLKGLTIQGYTSTEYVLVNHLNYQMAPGFWNPCVPVKK